MALQSAEQKLDPDFAVEMAENVTKFDSSATGTLSQAEQQGDTTPTESGDHNQVVNKEMFLSNHNDSAEDSKVQPPDLKGDGDTTESRDTTLSANNEGSKVSQGTDSREATGSTSSTAELQQKESSSLRDPLSVILVENATDCENQYNGLRIDDTVETEKAEKIGAALMMDNTDYGNDQNSSVGCGCSNAIAGILTAEKGIITLNNGNADDSLGINFEKETSSKNFSSIIPAKHGSSCMETGAAENGGIYETENTGLSCSISDAIEAGGISTIGENVRLNDNTGPVGIVAKQVEAASTSITGETPLMAVNDVISSSITGENLLMAVDDVISSSITGENPLMAVDDVITVETPETGPVPIAFIKLGKDLKAPDFDASLDQVIAHVASSADSLITQPPVIEGKHKHEVIAHVASSSESLITQPPVIEGKHKHRRRRNRKKTQEVSDQPGVCGRDVASVNSDFGASSSGSQEKLLPPKAKPTAHPKKEQKTSLQEEVKAANHKEELPRPLKSKRSRNRNKKGAQGSDNVPNDTLNTQDPILVDLTTKTPSMMSKQNVKRTVKSRAEKLTVTVTNIPNSFNAKDKSQRETTVVTQSGACNIIQGLEPLYYNSHSMGIRVDGCAPVFKDTPILSKGQKRRQKQNAAKEQVNSQHSHPKSGSHEVNQRLQQNLKPKEEPRTQKQKSALELPKAKENVKSHQKSPNSKPVPQAQKAQQSGKPKQESVNPNERPKSEPSKPKQNLTCKSREGKHEKTGLVSEPLKAKQKLVPEPKPISKPARDQGSKTVSGPQKTKGIQKPKQEAKVSEVRDVTSALAQALETLDLLEREGLPQPSERNKGKNKKKQKAAENLTIEEDSIDKEVYDDEIPQKMQQGKIQKRNANHGARNAYSLLKQGRLNKSPMTKKESNIRGNGKGTSQEPMPGAAYDNFQGRDDEQLKPVCLPLVDLTLEEFDEDNMYGRHDGPSSRNHRKPKHHKPHHNVKGKGTPDKIVGDDRRHDHVTGRASTPRQHNVNTGEIKQETQPQRDQGQATPSNKDMKNGYIERQNNQSKDGKRQDRKPQKKPFFCPHWSKEMISQGLKKGFLIEGTIRVNPKNYEDSYIPSPDGKSDIYISGFANRNRALNGDTVAVLVNDHSEWRVHLDSFEKYEEEVLREMKKLTIDEAADKDADIIIESVETIEISDSMATDESAEIIQSKQLLQADSSQSIGIPVIEASLKRNDESANCLSGQSSASSSPKKPINLTPKKGHCDNRTPSGSRYTSVKDVLTQNGASPVAQRLFNRDPSHNSSNDQDLSHKFVQRTGKVLGIIEAKHSRACSGYIKPMSDKHSKHALFCPTDHRCPRIMVPISDCPKDFLERPNDHSNTLFIARITDWPDTSQYAHGNLARSLGEAGLIEPETEAMLIEYDVDYSEFSAEALESLPKESPWVISPEELAKRKDLRSSCIFTIDPATARDLDDALSCEDLGNGLYEVGVHIADVSYFLQETTALDKVASQRATSVYLVQKVIPMLPRLLCEELCSLNPDKDRLTFSVVWHMTEKGEIRGEWFGRSVIRSCVKLSYDHAQGFIENPGKEYTLAELPPISEGFSVSKIRERVLNLHKIAQNLRETRFENGALRLDQVKLQFSLDKDTGLPNGYSVYSQRDSNKLVEEFMLLANMAVGHKILNSFPQTSLLRRHPPPQTKMFDDLHELCNSLGVPVNTSSAGTLQQSLLEYQGDDEFSKARLQVLVSLCSKPMQNARYFCSGIIDDVSLFHHYALNVPVYTHFTSPIRRYPDVIVHRLLGAALGYCAEPKGSPQDVEKEAEHCNDKKTASKYVQERSADVFFSVFVKEVGPLEEPGMVMSVLDRAFDVFVLKLGVIKRVYCEKLPLDSFSFQRVKSKPTLTLVWSPSETNPSTVTQEISIFTMVTAILQSDEGPLKWSATVYHPDKK